MAALVVGLGIIVEPIPWRLVGLVWLYCLAWMFIEYFAKLQLYKHLEQSGGRHSRFVGRLRKLV